MAALSTENATFLSDIVAALPTMGERDRSFAEDVIATARRYGRLSDKQRACLERARERALNPKPVVTREVGDMAGVVALFDKAKQKLQYPRITMALRDGSPLVITMAGERAKVPGALNVTDGGPYGNNKWYGRVRRDGTWELPAREMEEGEEVAHILHRLSAEPAKTASEYGRLTGCCCFCARHLTDERSLEVGYGATCAKNYGLPWGETH